MGWGNVLEEGNLNRDLAMVLKQVAWERSRKATCSCPEPGTVWVTAS